MIKARLEIKSLRIWLICITLFLWGAVICAPFLGLLNDRILYDIFPFLNFGLEISGNVFGREIPAAVRDYFSFSVSLLCVIAAIGLFSHIIYVAILNILKNQRRRAEKTLRKEGYSRSYFELLERKSSQLKGTSLAPKNDLCLAKEYCDGRRYDNALEVLRSVDIDSFDVKDALRYYSLYSYIFVLTGSLNNARFSLDLGAPFAEKVKDRSEYDFVSSLLMYAEHNYDGALEGFGSILLSKNIEMRIWAGMYMGLIYLRKHQKEDARSIVVGLSKYKKTARQSEDMLKLLKKIETAYALEDAEDAEKIGIRLAAAAQ